MARTLSVMGVAGESYPLARPFRISRGVKTCAEVVSVTLSEGGVTGRGEGIPYPRYGESVARTIAAIEAQRAMLEAGCSRAGLLAALPPARRATRSIARCGIWNCALPGAPSVRRSAWPIPRRRSPPR